MGSREVMQGDVGGLQNLHFPRALLCNGLVCRSANYLVAKIILVLLDSCTDTGLPAPLVIWAWVIARVRSLCPHGSEMVQTKGKTESLPFQITHR